MSQITLDQYWMGRNITYKKELTPQLISNAEHIVECTNNLLQMMVDDGVKLPDVKVNSGWRPKSVNDKTPGADPNSPHVTCEGIDLGEYLDKRIRKWINANPDKVKEAGFVSIEHFSATPTWCHLGTIGRKFSWQKCKVIWVPDVGGWKSLFDNKVLKSLL